MKQKKWWILGGAAALVLALVLILTLGGRDRQGEIVTPGRDTLNIPMIPGFTPGANAPSGETEPTQAAEPAPTKPDPTGPTKPAPTKPDETEPTEAKPSDTKPTNPKPTEPKPTTPPATEPAPTEPPVPHLSDDCLTLTSLGGYSGNFLEDGSDDVVSNVAAILVTNNADRMLQVADITFQVSETEQAVFRITDLPAGATVLALELKRRPYSDADDYTYGQTASGYVDTPSLEEERFDLDTTQAGKLTLKNRTDEAYGKVYVYYKYVQVGGIYLGGITYRVPFENLPAGGTAESPAGHFHPKNSRIMAVVVMAE